MRRAGTHGRPRIGFVVNVDWFFLSHRLAIARAAREAGAEVVVLTGDTGRGGEIRAAGFEFHPIDFPLGGGLSPRAEFRAARSLERAYRTLAPDLVHHNTFRPILYGTRAAGRLDGVAVVNTVSGLGFLFGESLRARVLRSVIRPFLRRALCRAGSRTILQNPDDLELLVAEDLLDPRRGIVIVGSGVDVDRFRPFREPEEPSIVLLAGRMLWDKGVEEFVEAARLVRARRPGTRFVLAGEPYAGNPRSVPRDRLVAWNREGDVEWWGRRDDMPEVLARAAIVVLPSYYREGAPKILLEAAAAGRPVVTTDAPGCRETVDEGVTGRLVPPRDPVALASAIDELLADPARRRHYGEANRRRAVAEFSEEKVAAATVSVYRDLLGARWGGTGR